MKSKTLSQHLSDASKARWAKTTPEERSAYAKMMVQKREEKRLAARAAANSEAQVAASDLSDIKDTEPGSERVH